MTAFGAELQRLRLAAGLSQSRLAHKAGVDSSYVSRVERGERPPPTRQVILALCRELQATAEKQETLLLLAGHWTPLTERLAAIVAMANDPSARRVLEAFAEAWEARL